MSDIVQAANEMNELKKAALAALNSDRLKEEIAKVVPGFMTPEQALRIAITTIMGNHDLIRVFQTNAGKASLLNALLRCAEAGLPVDGYHAHLVVFYNERAEAHEVQAIFDYKGIVFLAAQGGYQLKSVLVCEKDEFEYIEDNGNGCTILRHKYDPFSERGEILGVYARAYKPSQPPVYYPMSISDVYKIRDRSRSYRIGKGPWVTDPIAMILKTPARQIRKWLGLPPVVARAFEMDDDKVEDAIKPEPLFKSPKIERSSQPTVEIPNGVFYSATAQQSQQTNETEDEPK